MNSRQTNKQTDQINEFFRKSTQTANWKTIGKQPIFQFVVGFVLLSWNLFVVCLLALVRSAVLDGLVWHRRLVLVVVLCMCCVCVYCCAYVVLGLGLGLGSLFVFSLCCCRGGVVFLLFLRLCSPSSFCVVTFPFFLVVLLCFSYCCVLCCVVLLSRCDCRVCCAVLPRLVVLSFSW
jgi:hypothetical protein